MVSLEPEKIITIQISTGSQYVMRERTIGTGHGSVEPIDCRVSNKAGWRRMWTVPLGRSADIPVDIPVRATSDRPECLDKSEHPRIRELLRTGMSDRNVRAPARVVLSRRVRVVGARTLDTRHLSGLDHT